MRLSALTGLAVALVACASHRPPPPPPEGGLLPVLRLSPASLGESVQLTQQLSFTVAGEKTGEVRTLEALLEIHPTHLGLAAFHLGQRVFTLGWNGTSLEEERSPVLPAAFHAGWVLRDIQLVYWPVEQVRAALPAGWSLEDTPTLRVLRQANQERVRVLYTGEQRFLGQVLLINQAEGYQLKIDSRRSED